MTIKRALMVSLLSALAGSAGADVWDTQTDNDNSTGTDNELVHGSLQVHDLGVLAGNVADQDWYLLGQKPFSSYEIVIDQTSGDISSGKGPQLDRIQSDGTTVLQTSEPVSDALLLARSLRIQNTTAVAINDQYIRVISTGCGTDCGPDDQYRLRAYETTGAIARFNNGGGQATVVVLQNPTNYPIAGTLVFWNPSGVALRQEPFTMVAHGVYTLNAAGIPALAGQSGAITVLHNARYGDLVGKSVALDAANGFSFDTPLTIRLR